MAAGIVVATHKPGSLPGTNHSRIPARSSSTRDATAQSLPPLRCGISPLWCASSALWCGLQTAPPAGPKVSNRIEAEPLCDVQGTRGSSSS